MLARAVAKYLDANVDGLTFNPAAAGGNVFVAHMPDTPNTAVMVMPTGGREQLTQLPIDLPTIQVMTRGEPMSPIPPYELAQAIYSALACLDSTLLDPAGDDEAHVVTCTPAQAGPISIGRDANDRHEWTVNFRLRTHAPTAHRPEITA